MSGLRSVKRSMQRALVAQVRAEAKADGKPMPDEALANSLALEHRHTTLAGMDRRNRRSFLGRIRNHLKLLPKPNATITPGGDK